MTILPARERYIHFTKPFFSFSISALINKKNVKNLKTIDDLAVKSNLSVGVLSPSNTLVGMTTLKKDVRNIRWLYERIMSNESNLIKNNEDALKRVFHEPFVFLQEE